jgi:hypothetical protein
MNRNRMIHIAIVIGLTSAVILEHYLKQREIAAWVAIVSQCIWACKD